MGSYIPKNLLSYAQMRYAILADIHGNLEALTAVLDDIGEKGDIEAIWCLGDIVGYGPEPRKCIEKLRDLKLTAVAGNHDLAAVQKIPLTSFNPDGIAAIRWAQGQITPEDWSARR